MKFVRLSHNRVTLAIYIKSDYIMRQTNKVFSVLHMNFEISFFANIDFIAFYLCVELREQALSHLCPLCF